MANDENEVGTLGPDERFRPGGPGVGAKGGPDEVGTYDLDDPANEADPADAPEDDDDADGDDSSES